jgi:hypothetical protein
MASPELEAALTSVGFPSPKSAETTILQLQRHRTATRLDTPTHLGSYGNPSVVRLSARTAHHAAISGRCWATT